LMLVEAGKSASTVELSSEKRKEMLQDLLFWVVLCTVEEKRDTGLPWKTELTAAGPVVSC
jgi:hypothetical protein